MRNQSKKLSIIDEMDKVKQRREDRKRRNEDLQKAKHDTDSKKDLHYEKLMKQSKNTAATTNPEEVNSFY